MRDTVGAFIETFTLDGAAEGPLAGMSLAVKDLYDVAGHTTGFGNPDWKRTHAAPAERHAAAVAPLLEAGARIVGKTHTDEIAYSLMGANAHYGTPVNSADPSRVPGGSSSGSVAAVAAGLADIGLGSDTGGSVRAPASFCGVYGIRTSHGRISLDDARPLAPSFDTVGWFCRGATALAAAGEVLGVADPGPAPGELLLPLEIWSAADPATVDALGPALREVEAVYGRVRPVRLTENGLDDWFEAFRVIQAAEAWRCHGAWVTETEPDFGPGVRERFEAASRVTPEALAEAESARERITERMAALLEGGAMAVYPTVPGPAPKRDADEPTLDAYRGRALRMLCVAGLARLPQLSMPAGVVDGGPVGLSLTAAHGGDGALLAAAQAVSQT